MVSILMMMLPLMIYKKKKSNPQVDSLLPMRWPTMVWSLYIGNTIDSISDMSMKWVFVQPIFGVLCFLFFSISFTSRRCNHILLDTCFIPKILESPSVDKSPYFFANFNNNCRPRISFYPSLIINISHQTKNVELMIDDASNILECWKISS